MTSTTPCIIATVVIVIVVVVVVIVVNHCVLIDMRVLFPPHDPHRNAPRLPRDAFA